MTAVFLHIRINYFIIVSNFTTVQYHTILLSKLKYYGIKGRMYLLLESYLSNRYQRVKFNNIFSKWGKITKGVSQGSILGPLLFLIYINDLPSFIKCFGPHNASVILFADDTSVLTNDLNFMNLINHTLI